MHKTAINPPSVFNTLQYGFSLAVEVRGGRRLMLSGQVGVDASERTVGPGLLEQTSAAVDNIETLLAEVGGGLGHVVMLRIYIAESARHEQDALSRYCASASRLIHRRLRGSSSVVCPCLSG